MSSPEHTELPQLLNKAFILKFLKMKVIPDSERITLSIEDRDDRPRFSNRRTVYRDVMEITVTFKAEQCYQTGTVADLEREYVSYLRNELQCWENIVSKKDEELASLGLNYEQLLRKIT